MEGVQGLVAKVGQLNLNLRVLNEPRGFIKVLQFIISICAFATTTSFSTSYIFATECSGTDEKKSVLNNGTISYPFEIDGVEHELLRCGSNPTSKYRLMGDFSSDAEFFVAVGVLAFLYVLAILVLYIGLNPLYENNDLVPTVDCAMHVVLAVLWLAASSAWANSLQNLKNATSEQAVLNAMNDSVDDCNLHTCTMKSPPQYTKLVISIIFGFLNVFLWVMNLWFLYKETPYFKAKTLPTDDSAQPAPRP